MDWEKLDIHIENLVPGLATVWALSQFRGIRGIQANVESAVVVGIALLGVAYFLGVFANVVGRALLDLVSEHLTRQLMFRISCESKLKGARNASRAALNKAYNRYCTSAIQNQHICKEVAKRRQTARLLRSSLIPVVVLTLYLRPHFWGQLVILQVACVAFLEYGVLLLLYGYSEATILHEAYHAVSESDRRVLESDAEDGRGNGS